MSDEQEHSIISELERFASIIPLIKALIGGAGFILAAVSAVAVWTYLIEGKIESIHSDVGVIKPKIEAIETWKVQTESRSVVNPVEVYSMDKRLQRVEDSQAVMLEMMRRIEGKLHPQ